MIRPWIAPADLTFQLISISPALVKSGGFFFVETPLYAMPKLPDHRITIRLKPDEYALMMAKAGNKPLSTFLRNLALETAVKRRNAYTPAPVEDKKALSQALALLGQHKLVSAFKKAGKGIENGVQPGDDETKLLLHECRDLLDRIHKLLMRALGVAER